MLIPGITIQAGTSADIQITPQMTVFGRAGGRIGLLVQQVRPLAIQSP